METIRTWDWRAASVEARPPAADEKTLTASVLATTAAAEVRQELESRTNGPSPVQGASDTQSLVLEPIPRPVTDPSEPLGANSDTQSVVVERVPHAVTDQSAPADPVVDTQTVVLEPAAPMGAEDASADSSSPSEPGPGPRADTWRGSIGRLWSQRWTKVTVVCLAAVVAVLLIIWGIRLTHQDPGSSGPNLPPPSTTTTRAASSQTAQTSFVAPITSAQLAQYEQYAAGLQTANVAASKGFVGTGSTPTSTQMAPVVAAYRTAVNLYDFQLRFIQWPASMQPAIQVDHSQLEALVSLLQSFSTVSPTGTGPWLAELHNRAGTTQTADNVIRKDVGLPTSSSFP